MQYDDDFEGKDVLNPFINDGNDTNNDDINNDINNSDDNDLNDDSNLDKKSKEIKNLVKNMYDSDDELDKQQQRMIKQYQNVDHQTFLNPKLKLFKSTKTFEES